MNQKTTPPLNTLIAPNTTVETALFSSFNLDSRLESAVLSMGYTMATPIQTQAIPLVMKGFDVMGAAQTGTGKTAAFSLPILHRMLAFASTSPSPARHPVKALILAPTRELADQIYVNLQAYAKSTPIRTAVIFGGMDFKPQEAQLRAGVDVLVATPGRLLDHVNSQVLNLSQVNMLVLDEADRMLDMGFMPDLDRIVALLPKTRQTLLFSATFNEAIRQLAQTFLTQTPHYIETAKRNATANTVKQCVIEVTGNKDAALIALLKQNNQENPSYVTETQVARRARSTQQTIVFVNSKLGCTRIVRALCRVGLRAEAIHGDRSQQERLATLTAFKANQIDVLVATDVAARGLDIVDLPCVINYDVPYHAEDYVHRIGRTGRAGASGSAYTLCSVDDARALADVEKFIKHKLTREVLSLESNLDDVERDRIRDVRQRRRDSMAYPEMAVSHEFKHERTPYRKNEDPFFSQLYVPKANLNLESNTSSQTAANRLKKAATKDKPVVAALLGGLNKQ
jgi:ATP-dependent RNA helicase RhlE